ncbi:phosphoethanolamine--lipid A transferase [Campylobacter sp. VicNov18]|uniref:phosphoethanolamine transferase n=1 Tax=Campylobacter bilis TaxID=2691918 RepID=UPI00130E8A92|nr:phosphoethanolamine--lipid A transferase [Campylobacter bilis]MPV62932.1 phosphoethanolamine--lipid A transferase [Campylobacter hepaticus]MBM0636431.1 phosphoethanolamine--lipid A transferase [Campylobacter bilis]MCC8277140.1 phosphoethanolamine--lipid A transferase [Campylobacter bilis]MCC8298883.1 phosphoethanolamine--lipid A transferase [Campylobacter bilis]MCC8300049.1 phosphoethanolamine--lipid A transferase [Campylobacter bilis]
MFKITWLQFTFLNSFMITLLNFNLFYLVYEKNDHNLFITITFIIAYFALVHAICSLLFVRFFTKFFCVLFILSSFLSVYFISFYGVLISSDMIQNIVQTDLKEIKDLLNFKLILVVFLIILLILWLFKLKITYYNDFKTYIKIKILNIVLALMVVCAILFPLSKTFIPFFRNHNEIRMYNIPFYPLYSVYRYSVRFMQAKPEFKIIAEDAYKDDNNTKKLLILVVGETARMANYSLGGYAKNDTNFYTKKDKVVFFNNFYSCATATAVSLPCMFSFSKREDYSSFEFQENAMDILKKTGVDTTWIDNNSGGCKGVCDRLDQKQILSSTFDAILLPRLKEKLNHLNTQNIIVLHLQGSHGPSYYKRYPIEFKKFTPTCDTNELSKCDNEALINTYDNTLLYTDYLLSQIIKLLKEYKDYKSSLLYLSDHGESLGENGIYLHGMPYVIAPQNQFHIPAIFWSNDEDLMKQARLHKNLKLSQDNLFSTLLGYFDIKTRVYEPQYDLLSPKLKANP